MWPYLEYKGEELYFNKRDIVRVVKRNGTPLKIFSPSVARCQVLWLREKLDEKIKIGYAFKSNPSQGILNEIRDVIDFLTVTDYRELPSLRHIFKKDILVVDVLSEPNNYERGIWVANSVEQYEEFRKKGVRRMIRYNPKIKSESIFSTHTSPFGVYKEEIEGMNLEEEGMEGIHAHLASNATNVGEWRIYLRDIYKLVKEMNVKKVNVGGGIPYPYNSAINVEEIIKELNRFASKLNDVEIWIEPGTFISAPTKIAALKIMKIINRGEWKAAIVNASVYNVHPDLLIRKEENIVLPLLKSSAEDRGMMSMMIRGRTMDSVDIFSSAFPYNVREGDVVILGDIGAYNYHADLFGLERIKEIII